MSFEAPFYNVFLFGAGASIPANLPDIKTLTNDFFESLEKCTNPQHILRSKIGILKNVTYSHFNERKDLESIMTLIKKLGNEK